MYVYLILTQYVGVEYCNFSHLFPIKLNYSALHQSQILTTVAQIK